MPYIRYKGRFYNVTTGSYIDAQPTLYTIGRYTGNQFSDVTDVTTRTDIQWSENFDGDFGNNIGINIEYYAKKYYYESNLTEWPVLRIYTTNDTEDYYIEWTHDRPHALSIKVNGNFYTAIIPFLWDDNIDISGEPATPIFNTLRPIVFTTAEDKEGLLIAPVYYGTFASTSITGGWVTKVTIQTITFTFVNMEWLQTNAGFVLAQNDSSNRVVSKRNDGMCFAWGYSPTDAGPNFSSACTGVILINGTIATGWDGLLNSGFNDVLTPDQSLYPNITIRRYYTSNIGRPADVTFYVPIVDGSQVPTRELADYVLSQPGMTQAETNSVIYYYLSGVFTADEPPSDVDPEDVPPEDEPPTPIPPDDPDPYYDPTSDPESPQYDPTKDPDSPEYDPSEPSTPWQPPTTPSDPGPAPILDPPSPVPVPVTPPTYANNSRLFTIYTPTVSQLTDFANFLWASPLDIPATFRKIVVSPMDCVLGLMVIPQLTVPHSSRELNIGNIGTGITMDYATSQFVDFDCGSVFLQEYYRSYLDYSPYTKLDIFLPFIGTRELSIDECMQKTISVIYRFDLASGTCIAFIRVNGTVLYQFDGNCASHIPLSSSDWGSTVRSIPANVVAAVKAGGALGGAAGALGIAAAASVMSMKERVPHSGSLAGSAGLMGIPYPYLIVTRPCQALPRSQNSFSGYPSFITMSLGECSGYTEVHQCHLEHVPATGEELEEIERLLKEGVLF